MSDVVIVGTDTGAGKTTLALLWMAAFSNDYDYWKPVETGESDSELVARLVPSARVHPPMARYRDAVAPALAARRAAVCPPTVADIHTSLPNTNAARDAATTPRKPHHLIIETFGSVMSPLNDDELQVRLASVGVKCALRGGGIRFSPHCYNTEEQISTAVDAI